MAVDVPRPLLEFIDTVEFALTVGFVGSPSAPQDATRPQNIKAVKIRVIQEPLSNEQFAHALVQALYRHSLSEKQPSFQPSKQCRPHQ